MLTFNPLHFPEVLCSVPHELLIFSWLVCFVQTAVFWSLAGHFVSGKLIASQGDHLTVVICHLRDRTASIGSQMSCASHRPPTSPAPAIIWDDPRKGTSVTPNVHRRMKISPPTKASLGLSLSPRQRGEPSESSVWKSVL